MNWLSLRLLQEPPLPCVACGRVIPDGTPDSNAIFFPREMPEDLAVRIERIFDVDAADDFNICSNCHAFYSQGEDLDPWVWLERYLAARAQGVAPAVGDSLDDEEQSGLTEVRDPLWDLLPGLR